MGAGAGSLQSREGAGQHGDGLFGVAGVVAQGCCDVVVSAEAEQAEDEVAHDGQDLGAVAGPGLMEILTQSYVADPVD